MLIHWKPADQCQLKNSVHVLYATHRAAASCGYHGYTHLDMHESNNSSVFVQRAMESGIGTIPQDSYVPHVVLAVVHNFFYYNTAPQC